MKRFKFLRVRILGLAAGILLAFCFTARGQMAVTQYDASGRPITATNPFWVTISGEVEIDTAIFQEILTQLEKNKYTGNDLRVIFSNSTIGVTGTVTEANSGDIKTNTDPLVTAGGGGYIRQDSTSTIAKESGGNLADIKTAVEAMETRLDDMTRSETDEWERFEVQGYSEVEKTYTNVNKISVAVETADTTIRVSANNYDTTTDYAVIRSDALGWTNGDLRYPSYTIKLKGDTETDTANVCVIVEKYVE
jgi:hypothetical protein